MVGGRPDHGAARSPPGALPVVLHVVAVVPLAAVLVLAVVTGLAYAVGWSPNVVSSGSMAPWLRPGDIVLAQPASQADLEEGDIVVFRNATGQRITHRLVARQAGGDWSTKGDANPTVDAATVDSADITGVIRLTIPRVGLPPLWIRKGELLPLLLWAGALALSGWGAVRTYKPAVRVLGVHGSPPAAAGVGRTPPAGQYRMVLLAVALAAAGLLGFAVWWATLAVATGSYVWVGLVAGALVLLVPGGTLVGFLLYRAWSNG